MTQFAPLITNRQKAALCAMAKLAYDEIDSKIGATLWRRQQQLKVCGKGSLTHCNQNDYRPLANHYLAIKNGAGSTPIKPRNPDWPTGVEPTKLWDRSVGGQLRKIGKLVGSRRSWSYADAIAARIVKVDCLDWCDSADLRKIIAALVYDKQRK